jgi:dihydrofolate reductase
MRKLIESTFVTLDGVISDPQVWASPYWDDEYLGYAGKLLEPAEAQLLGRVTYEGFAESWTQRSGDAFTDKFNAMPKYVASRTLKDATWNATVLKGDLAEEVARLKQEDGGTLLKYGTGELDRELLKHRLVDEFHFWIFPVIAGSGARLVEGIGDGTHLKLIDLTQFKSGITVNVYAPK